MTCEACGSNAVDDNDECIVCGHVAGDPDCICQNCMEQLYDLDEDDR